MLQLQSAAASHLSSRTHPLYITTTLYCSATEDVLWHVVLSYQQELKAAAEAEHAAAVAAAAGNQRKLRKIKEPRDMPPVSLHLLCPDELMSGMLTQVRVYGVQIRV